MKDFDFDELDKAVTSALGTTGSAAPDEATVSVKTTPLVREATPTVDRSLPARRSSGRFMDVVHPSSDMRASSDAPRSLVTPPRVEETVPSEPLPQPNTEEEAPLPASDDAVDVEPVTTPFISADTVEKRPLGAFSEAPFSDARSYDEDKTPLPKELSDEVLALDESAESVPNTPETHEVSEPAPLTDSPLPFQPPATHPASQPDAPHHIFDTESYHPPIAAPSKKKTALFITLWLLSLVLVGGGIGAGVYFFVLPLL